VDNVTKFTDYYLGCLAKAILYLVELVFLCSRAELEIISATRGGVQYVPCEAMRKVFRTLSG
jgi:hypothetical protein